MQKFITALVVLWCVAGSYGLLFKGKSFDQKNENEVNKKAFCHGRKCPKYEVIRKTENYEVRSYDQVVWAFTNTKKTNFEDASDKNFWKLFQYIEGANDKRKKMAMTVPVLNRIQRGQDDNFTMSFYMAGEMEDLPKPTDSSIQFYTIPARTIVYVKEFGGYYKHLPSWRKEAKELADAIGNPRVYDSSFFFAAGYDSPMRFFQRHNEIWFVGKPKIKDHALLYEKLKNLL